MSNTVNGLPVHDDGNVYRILGCLPPSGFCSLPLFGDSFPVVPENEWVDTEVDLSSVSVFDQGSHGSCFPAGTRIRLADGSEKPIEQIKLRDVVVTAEGRTGSVTQLMVRKADKGLRRLCLWGHRHLKMTPEHPVLTRRGYVPAQDLTSDDWVALPRYSVKTPNKIIATSNHVEINRWTVRKERHLSYAGVAGRAAAVIVKTPIPDIIQLTTGVGRIFGLFLAEGSTDSAKVVWTFNINETDTLVKNLVDLLHTELGVTAKVSPKPATNVVQVVVYGKLWALLFESLCATGAGAKRLHSDLTSGPPEFLDEVFASWLDGDGHARRGDVSGCSVSHDLALSMFDIAQAKGHRPSITLSKPSMNKHAKTRRPRWDVSLASQHDNYRVELTATHAYRKVRDVTAEEFTGDVYNFSVEGDESYVAEGIGVHNCVGHGSTTAFTFSWLLSGQVMHVFSPTSVYARINGNRDQGAQVGSAVNALKQFGTCLMDQFGEDKIYVSQMSRDAAQTALRFRALEAYRISNWQEMGSALTKGLMVVSGIAVGRNFSSLDANGVCPLPDAVIGGHCLAHYGLKKVDGNWMVATRNSWSNKWGRSGNCYLQEGAWSAQYGFPFDAFAIGGVKTDPQDPNQDPPVLI